MRRSSKRLGHVLEAYGHAEPSAAPRPGGLSSPPRLAYSSSEHEHDDGSGASPHEDYLKGVRAQAATYLEGLRAGERVMMRFEYHTLSPIDGGPRDIHVLDTLRELCRTDGFSFESEPVDDVGVHLVRAAIRPSQVRTDARRLHRVE